jgi:hypothetical protein
MRTVAGKASPIAITFSDAPSGNAVPGTLSHRICQILPKMGEKPKIEARHICVWTQRV